MFRTLIAPLFVAVALATALPAAQAAEAIDVNRATQAELESVKGIGPGLSTKILAARQAGAFKDWNDLVERVGGVGPGNAARFSQAGLTVAGSAYDGSAAAPAKARRVADRDGKAQKAEKTDKAARRAKLEG